MQAGAVILAGGKSRRMGKNKGELLIGGQRFIDLLAQTLSPFPERLLSVADACTAAPEGFSAVADRYPGSGPAAGLHAALLVCESEALLAVPCDVPLFPYELGQYLLSRLSPGTDAVVPVTRNGRVHPLCGAYRKEAAGVLERRILSGHLSVTGILESLRVDYMPLAGTPFPDACLSNINTPREYETLLRSMREETRI